MEPTGNFPARNRCVSTLFDHPPVLAQEITFYDPPVLAQEIPYSSVFTEQFLLVVFSLRNDAIVSS